MSTAGAVLTAEERRQRRLAKILGDSDGRINKILGGPDGVENRKAPAMEGGDFQSLATPSVSESLVAAPLHTLRSDNDSFTYKLYSSKFISLFLIALYALSCQIIHLNDVSFNIILPWVIGYCILEYFFVKDCRSLNADNQLMQMLFNIVPVEHSRSALFQNMGYITSFGKTFASDSGLMISCYVVFHSLSAIL